MGFSSTKFRRSYLFALTTVAALTLAAQWAVQTALDRAEGDASAINVAGRQRMLSQKLTKAAWVAEFAAEPSARDFARLELSEALESLRRAHAHLSTVVAEEAALQAQYARVNLLFERLTAAADDQLAGEGESANESLKGLSAAEAAYLPEMNRLVGTFEAVADGRINRLRQVEFALLLATLMVLSLEAWFIFEPLRRALLQRMHELTEARDVAERATRVQDEFLSTMSHGIRTPLNGVIGMSELLLESELTAQQRELATACNRSSRVLLSLVNDVLDYAKLEAGEFELEVLDMDPEALLDEVAQLVSPRLGGQPVELIVEGPREPNLRVRADPLRIRQVLINLASNAVKFTSEGQVVLRWGLQSREDAQSWLVFEVQDSGIGIPEERREAIFERFTQADSLINADFGGSGLGLALCREWSKRMGGDIHVESELGQGSLFRFSVPLDAAPNECAPAFTEVACKRRVALVLQHPQQRAAHARLLTQLGAEVLEYGTAEGLRNLPESELAGLDAVVIGRETLERGSLAGHLPEGLSAECVIVLNRGGDPLELPVLGTPPNSRSVAAALYRPARREALGSALGELWAQATPTAMPTDRAGDSERLAGLKVLAVEDNPVNRRLLEAHLEHFGCEYALACDGIEALERAAESEFGLVLMDCQMPRMDGYTASEKLREMPEGRDVVILALSANALPEHVGRCEAAGIDDWLSKPYTRADLREVLLKWLDYVPGRGVA